MTYQFDDVQRIFEPFGLRINFQHRQEVEQFRSMLEYWVTGKGPWNMPNASSWKDIHGELGKRK